MDKFNDNAIELFNLYVDMLAFGFYGKAQAYLRQLKAMHFTVREYNHQLYSLHTFNGILPIDTELGVRKVY